MKFHSTVIFVKDIEIGEPLEVFVNNMSGKGLSAKEISEKSGIPIDTVRELIKK